MSGFNLFIKKKKKHSQSFGLYSLLAMLTFVPILETIWFMNSNICPGACSSGDVKAVLHCIRAESPAWHSKAVRTFSTSNSSPKFRSHRRTYSKPLIATHIYEYSFESLNPSMKIDSVVTYYNYNYLVVIYRFHEFLFEVALYI